VDRIAGGITARTSAHLAPLCDDLTSAMIGLRGENTSRLFYESQAAAVDRIEEIQKRERIDCGFRRLDGYLFQALNTNAKIIDVIRQIEEKDDGSVVVTADGGSITAKAAVVATNSPIVDTFALHSKMAP
jgi:glycine/D-amino acid oxidase-like deaminating enzyme